MFGPTIARPLRSAFPWLAALTVVALACGEMSNPEEPNPPAEPDPMEPPPDPPPDPSAPAQLAFRTQPVGTHLGDVVSPAVDVVMLNAQGDVIATATAPVTIGLASNPVGATLGGTTTVSAIGGVATFGDLTLDASARYTLSAQAPDLPPVESEPFDVVFAMRQVTLGIDHTCGVAVTGVAYCWGDDNYGQLGVPAVGDASDYPVAVESGVAFETLTVGGGFTCGLTAGGVAYCWGNNVSGQLGDGNAPNIRGEPALVLGGHVFTRLAAAGTHACGVTPSGDAYCWGYNGDGQLGNAAAGNESDLPVLVDGGHAFVALVVGDSHTCGITADGDAYCWGDNFEGALGDGNAGVNSDVPVPVQGGHAFVSLTAGGSHTCGLTGGGAAYCWGANFTGELGNGDAGTSADRPQAVVGGHAFVALAEGGAENGHTCALTADGAAYCWGDNRDGKLGNDDPDADRDTPVMVLGGLTFVSLAAGGDHTCGITAAGAAYCWGSNQAGQLGDRNAEVDSGVPVPVADP